MIRFVLPKRGICAGDVVFQIDVLDAVGDRLAEQDQPGFLAARVLAAVLLAADGDDRRARPVLQQPLDVHARADVVEAQLDQLGALLAPGARCSAIMCL